MAVDMFKGDIAAARIWAASSRKAQVSTGDAGTLGARALFLLPRLFLWQFKKSLCTLNRVHFYQPIRSFVFSSMSQSSCRSHGQNSPKIGATIQLFQPFMLLEINNSQKNNLLPWLWPAHLSHMKPTISSIRNTRPCLTFSSNPHNHSRLIGVY